MKKTIGLVLLGCTMLFLSGCSSSIWNNGSFEGSGTGHSGPIKVEVTVAKGKISKVEVVEHSETPGIGDAAITKITAGVVEAQTAEVDSVTGATMTSAGLKEAIADALSKAEKK